MLSLLAYTGNRAEKLKPLVQAVEEPLRRGVGQRHHKRQVAEGHHAYKHHELLPRLGAAVCQIERVAGKVYLPFLARLMQVVVRVVVVPAILVYILLELGVAVAFGAHPVVVVLIDELHVCMLATETLQDLGHHPVQFRLPVFLLSGRLLSWEKDCFELVVGEHEQLSDGIATLVGPLLHSRHQALAALDLRTDLVLRKAITQQL
jgi:hypothetical protein